MTRPAATLLDITNPDADSDIAIHPLHSRWLFVGLGGAGSNVCRSMREMCHDSRDDALPCPLDIVTHDGGDPPIDTLLSRAGRSWLQRDIQHVVLLAALGKRTGGLATLAMVDGLARRGVPVSAALIIPFSFESTSREARRQLETLADSGLTLVALYNDDFHLLPPGTTLANAFARANRVVARAAVLGALTGSHAPGQH